MNSKKEKEKEKKEDKQPKKKNALEGDNTNILTKNDKVQHKNNNNTTHSYNPYIHYQHTNRSLQNNITPSKYILKIQTHPLQNNIHVSR